MRLTVQIDIALCNEEKMVEISVNKAQRQF